MDHRGGSLLEDIHRGGSLLEVTAYSDRWYCLQQRDTVTQSQNPLCTVH